MTELFIHWNPSNTAFELGPLAVRWYSLCWCVGLVSVYLLMHRLFRQHRPHCLPCKSMTSIT